MGIGKGHSLGEHRHQHQRVHLLLDAEAPHAVADGRQSRAPLRLLGHLDGPQVAHHRTVQGLPVVVRTRLLLQLRQRWVKQLVDLLLSQHAALALRPRAQQVFHPNPKLLLLLECNGTLLPFLRLRQLLLL